MRKSNLFLFVFSALLLFSPPLLAADIVVLDPWVREAPPAMQVHAAYMVIQNKGPVGKTIIGAVSPAYAKVEFHETLHQNGMATMVARDSLVVDSGSQVVLKPGGYHMMLIAPQGPHPVKAGSVIPIELRFSDGSKLMVEAAVRAGQPGAPMHHDGMSHDQHMQHMQHMGNMPAMQPAQPMQNMQHMQHMGH